MADIQALKASVLAQAHQEGRELLAEARVAIDKEFSLKQQALLNEREGRRASLLGAVKNRFQREEQQLQNQVRQSTLVTKNQVLREIFKSAQEQMENWDREQQVAFIGQLLSAYAQEEVSVQFGEYTLSKLREEDLAQLQSLVPGAQFSGEGIGGEGGMIISRGQVDDNFLYSRLVDSLWSQESYQMASRIFTED